MIGQGRHALLVAPTGSGKTLAAFLAGIDHCINLPEDAQPVRVLYISPSRRWSTMSSATCVRRWLVFGTRPRSLAG